MHRFALLTANSSAFIVLAAMALAGGCGESATSAIVSGAVNRVELTPSAASLRVGETIPFVATALDGQNRALTGKSYTFAIDRPAVASVSTSGVVTALGLGDAMVTVTSEGKSANASITVSNVQVSGDVIDVIPQTTYQTMLGWEGTWQTGEADKDCGASAAAIPNYRQLLFGQLVDDLGITRIRMELRAGVENPDPTANTTYNSVNDNGNPNVINAAGFQWGDFDAKIEMRALPLRQAVQARGEQPYFVLTYVDFGPNSAWEHSSEPAEYAELILATYQHMQGKYGFVPDAVEIELEPDHTSFNALELANALVATGDRLKAAGFTPDFIAPSTTSMANASTWFDQMVTVPRVMSYLTDLAYHRYTQVSPAALSAIAARATQHGIRTSMNEHIGSGYEDLHEDLVVGRVSSWQQYTLAFCGSTDRPEFYYWIDNRNPANVQLTISGKTKSLRQYFKFIRPGAVRVGAASSNAAVTSPVAFRNANGKFVVVVKATAASSFSVRGLPAGMYGIKFTTGSQYNVDRPDVTISGGGVVEMFIPAAGVITLYGR